MSRLPISILALSLLLSVTTARFCFPCQFRFCYGPQQVKLGTAEKALRGPLCLKDGTKIGIFNAGEARVYSQSRFGYDPISISNPPGLLSNFSKSLFKAYPTSHYFTDLRKTIWVSGVGHEHFKTNQLEKIKGQCVILPIVEYQILDDKWDLVRNVNDAGPWHDSCVDFFV